VVSVVESKLETRECPHMEKGLSHRQDSRSFRPGCMQESYDPSNSHLTQPQTAEEMGCRLAHKRCKQVPRDAPSCTARKRSDLVNTQSEMDRAHKR
jgi:hypothetical protein